MTIELLSSLLGWAAVLNYAVLCAWLLVFSLAHDWMYNIHKKWFNITPEAFDVIHYTALVLY